MSSTSDIVVFHDGLRAGGYTFPLPTAEHRVHLAFGQPDRIWKGYPNHLLFWDAEGLWAYQDRRTGEVTGIGARFGRSPGYAEEARPKATFRHAVVAGDVRVDPSATARRFLEAGFIRESDREWSYPLGSYSVEVELDERDWKPTEVEILFESGEPVKLGLITRLRLAWTVLTKL